LRHSDCAVEQKHEICSVQIEIGEYRKQKNLSGVSHEVALGDIETWLEFSNTSTW